LFPTVHNPAGDTSDATRAKLKDISTNLSEKSVESPKFEHLRVIGSQKSHSQSRPDASIEPAATSEGQRAHNQPASCLCRKLEKDFIKVQRDFLKEKSRTASLQLTLNCAERTILQLEARVKHLERIEMEKELETAQRRIIELEKVACRRFFEGQQMVRL
jgi:hypothetical protein